MKWQDSTSWTMHYAECGGSFYSKCVCMDSLPTQVLQYIFSFVPTDDCLTCTGVSLLWRDFAFRHCSFVVVRTKPCRDFRLEIIGSKSKFSKQNDVCNIQRNKNNTLVRTKGHLPDPIVLEDEMTLVYREEKKVDSVKVEIPISSRLECVDNGQHEFITSLDLEHSLLNNKSLGKIIIHLNLGCLNFLKRLSVSRCRNLKTLTIPSQLEGLDARSCAELLSIRIGSSSELVNEPSLKLLNLNGCRKLITTTFPNDLLSPRMQSLTNLVEFDITSANSLSKTSISNSLAVATCLESISLRYIANDDMIYALSASPSARNNLKVLDAAFSSLTDEAVASLIQSTTKLERFNLRGCSKISSQCYNEVPLYLSKRLQGEDDSFRLSDVYTSRKKRKGDNLFLFI